MLTCCNCTESLLTSSIPDLQFDPFAIKLYGPYLEINAIRERPILWDQKQFVEEKEKKTILTSNYRRYPPYGCNKASGEGTIRETQKEATFTHSCQIREQINK